MTSSRTQLKSSQFFEKIPQQLDMICPLTFEAGDKSSSSENPIPLFSMVAYTGGKMNIAGFPHPVVYAMWDANGDAVVEGNNWLGTTVHAASSGTSYMWPTAVGNNVTPEDYPNWLPGNPNVDPWIHTRGYGVYTARTLIRWNVAGGLTYIAD